MKTIIKDGTYVRVSNQEAEMKIKAGWSFCSKSDWKKNVRDFGREEVVEKKKKYKLDRLIIQQKVDYYRVLLLNKYGGLYLDADTIVMKNPIEIVNKLKSIKRNQIIRRIL